MMERQKGGDDNGMSSDNGTSLLTWEVREKAM